MIQADALRETVSGMELKPEHGALVAYCEGLAEQIDLHPERATLWREYRPAVEFLISLADVDEEDGQAAFLELVRSPVGDKAKSGSGDVGAGSGGGGSAVGSAVDAVAAAGRGRRSRASA